MRAEKTVSGQTTRFVHGLDGKLLYERNLATNQRSHHIYLGGQPIALVRNGTLHYVLPDHLGRPEIVVNHPNQPVWRAQLRAFDRRVVTDQIGGYDLGFPGQYHDTESGFAYNVNRDYDPATGRYLQSDPIGLAGGINTYAYAGSSPAMAIDWLGLQSRDLESIYRYSGATSPSVGYHPYSISVPLCSECSLTDAFNAMRNFSAPGAPYARDGTRDLLLPGSNPIRQTVDPCNRTITNATLPGHRFGGAVTISIVRRNGVVSAQIVGAGVGPNPIQNQIFGPMIFEGLGFAAYLNLNPNVGIWP